MAAKVVGRFGPRLRELRLHLCQKSPESQGARTFIEKHYVSLKKKNPTFPILIRECSGVQPRVFARYERGKEESLSLVGMDGDQVLQAITKLASQ